MNENRNGGAAVEEDEGEAEVGTVDGLMDAGVALSAVDRAAIDVQVATAKRYPRSVDKALKEALTLATLDEETAASMFYALPRSGKTIEGPSARLAEIMAYSWGNLRVDADIVAEDKTHVTAMGTCFDLEKNVAVRVRVKRRITDKKGKRLNEDMIGVTSNAAISIALRNSVFKVIPAALIRRIYLAARTASLGKGGTITQKRQKALEWFGKLGVQPEQVFQVLDVKGIDDIGEEQLITLRGLRTAIQEGETTVEQAFGREQHSEGTDELNQALKAKAAADAQQPQAGPESDQTRAADVAAAKAATKEQEDDGAPPTEAQLTLLAQLREKSGEFLLLEDQEAIDRAVESKNGPAVRGWIKSLQKELAKDKTLGGLAREQEKKGASKGGKGQQGLGV